MVTERANLTKGKKEDGDKVKGLWHSGTQGKCPQSQETLSVLSTTLLGYSRKLLCLKQTAGKPQARGGLLLS